MKKIYTYGLIKLKDNSMLWYHTPMRRAVLKAFQELIIINTSLEISLDNNNGYEGFKIIFFNRPSLKQKNAVKELTTFINGKKFQKRFFRTVCARHLQNEVFNF